MKMNQLFTICGIAAALALSTGSLLAQNNPGGNGGGPGRFGGWGNMTQEQRQQLRTMTPEQRQQFFMKLRMNSIRDQLGFTNVTDWNAVQPLIQKVMDARRDLGAAGGRRVMFRGPGRNDQNSPRQSPQEQALQQAVDNHVPDAQLKQALERYQDSLKQSLKQKEAALTEAQDNLRKVLTIRQEAQATLMGLLQ